MMKKFFSLLVVALVATVMMAETASVTFSEAGYANGDEVVAERLGKVVVAFDKGTNSNAPKYYTTGTAARCYAKNTMTFASDSATITQIKLTYGSGDGTNAITANKGTFATNTWTGSESSVVLTIDGTNGHRRIATIEVTYTVTVAEGSAEFDGTVTANPSSISSLADLEGLKLTFVNATTVALMDEDDMGGIILGSETGSAMYAIWHPSLGGACTIAGNVVTLTGWLTGDEDMDDLPAESCTLYMEDYGNFVVDGEDLDEFETIEISYTASGAGPGPEPIATITAGKYYVTTFLADSNIVATSLAANKTYGYLPVVTWTGYTEDMTAAEEYEFVAVAGEHAHFYIKMGDGRYLYQTGSYNSYNVTNDTATVGAKWEVEIMGNYHKITNVEKQKVVQFDEQYHTFGSYSTITRTLPTLVAVPSVSTSVENVEAAKAVKFIENGMLIIEKNGVRYSALGARL